MDIEPYFLPDPMPWTVLAGPLTEAEDAVARLDERLRASRIREGWIARTHFADACASLWLEGELVHLEDLVLHDAGMDVRGPTHELVRAHTVLRARRRIAEAAPEWLLSSAGLDALRGRHQESTGLAAQGRAVDGGEADEDVFASHDIIDEADGDDAWAAQMAAFDAVLARSDNILAGDPVAARPERDPLVYDLDWDEDARIAEWRALVAQTEALPPILAASLALDAWEAIEPLQHAAWLGRLLAAALLTARGKTRAHLVCLNSGLRAIPRERRLARNPTARLTARLHSFSAAAEVGLKDHDRWLMARGLLERKLAGRRSTSKLPALIELIVATPIVSAKLIAAGLGVTPRAAQDLVAELGLREITGRGRYRAWGIV